MNLSLLGFDRVVIMVDGSAQEMDVESFMSLPLKVKVSHLMRSELEFYDGDAVVSPREALKQMRRAAAD